MNLDNYKVEFLIETVHAKELSDAEYFSSDYKQYVSNSKLKLINPDEGGSPQKFKEGIKSEYNASFDIDYFKYVLASIKNVLGGRLTSYESIVERARREAIVRLKQQAQSVGATHIMGVRLSTTELGMQGGMVEVFAYGTAVKD